DGATKKTYEKIRKGSSFDKLINNIKLIRDFKVRYQVEQPCVTFNFVAMKSTIEELEKLVELAHEYNAGEVIVSDLLVFDQSMEREKLLFTDPILQASYDAAAKKAVALGVRLVLPHTYSAWKEHQNKNDAIEQANNNSVKDEPQPYNVCTEPWSSFWLSQEGDVTPCCYWFKKMGNINEVDFTAIWNNDEYQDFRSIVNSSDRPTQCKQCPIP
ncbi:SPASM domain-containing protein, partial [Candidatus Omnitrophota bacterium]